MDFLVEGMNEERMKEIIAGYSNSSAEALCPGLDCNIDFSSICWEREKIIWTSIEDNPCYIKINL